MQAFQSRFEQQSNYILSKKCLVAVMAKVGWIQEVMKNWSQKICQLLVNNHGKSVLLLTDFAGHKFTKFINSEKEIGASVELILGWDTRVSQPCEMGIMRSFKASISQVSKIGRRTRILIWIQVHLFQYTTGKTLFAVCLMFRTWLKETVFEVSLITLVSA